MAGVVGVLFGLDLPWIRGPDWLLISQSRNIQIEIYTFGIILTNMGP